MLLPMGKRLKVLKSVWASPRLFSVNNRRTLKSRFRSLKKLHLELAAENQGDFMSVFPQDMFASIEAGHLLEFLVCAGGLEDLHISFTDMAEHPGPYAHISKIMGNYSWPYLKKLSLSNVEGSIDEYIKALVRQPVLQELGLSSIELSSGSWSKMFIEMRVQLSLQKTNFNGVFISPSEDEMMVMEYYNQNLWDEIGCPLNSERRA